VATACRPKVTAVVLGLLGSYLRVQVEIAVALIAPKVVINLGVGANRPETRDEFVMNPATGTLELIPTHRDEAAEAFQGVLAGTKARLYFGLCGFYCQKFTLEVRDIVFRIHSQIGGYFDKLL
jgi:hypothetical protein